MTYDESYLNGTSFHDEVFMFDRPVSYDKRRALDYVKSYFYDIFYKLLLWWYPVKESEYKYNVSLCSIFKNEAPFLKEWIEYHLLVGVDHFYLYNNNSEDDYQAVLQPYVEKGIVTLVDWPEIPGQLSSYKHWYANFRNETKWVSFLDLDEFVCPRYNNTISAWLKKWEKYPVIMIYWRMFGTSGRLDHDFSKLTIEQYVNSWDKLDNVGKLFYQTKYDIDIFYMGMMHSFNVKLKRWSIPPINTFGRFVMFNIHRAKHTDIEVQINHYWSKAYTAYEAKHKRGDATFVESPRNYEYFLWHEQKNNSVDMSIFRYVIQLKQRLGLTR